MNGLHQTAPVRQTRRKQRFRHGQDNLELWGPTMRQMLAQSPQHLVMVDRQGRFIAHSQGTIQALQQMGRGRWKPGLCAEVLETIGQLARGHLADDQQIVCNTATVDGIDLNVISWPIRDCQDRTIGRLINWQAHGSDN